ncbi:cadherin-like beta sandwich domain-containing protein [Mesorhizobium sp. ANAO-SY3R2]|uniref:cadherin-like beta sandwich domain-containing protein n=1 Tax=Mesorhizobium sp. ANAO-SY3R2 TaxID=3166644 RepID=UPI00366B649F
MQTQPALAQSPGCSAINATWGGSVTLTDGDELWNQFRYTAPAPDTPFDGISVQAGEKITYTVTTSGAGAPNPNDNSGFAIYKNNGANYPSDIILEEKAVPGDELSLSGSHVVSADDDGYVIYAWSGSTGGTVHATVTCTATATPPSITAQPSNSTTAAGANTTFSVTASNATSYQWQVNTGSGFIDISNGAPYSGATTATLTITGATAGMNGYLYRVVATGLVTPNATSNSAALTVNAALSSDATLSNIWVGVGTLTPTFDKQTTEYSVSVPSGTNVIWMNADTSDPDATYHAGGVGGRKSGSSWSTSLNFGDNTVTIIGKAADGVTTKTYTVTVTRAAAAPTLTSAAPNSGNAAGGTTVTLSGSNLTGASAVRFGGTSASSFTVVNDTTITATIPAHAAGSVDVSVNTPGGSATLTSGFTYTLASDATLANLTISSGTLSPGFAAGTTSYTAAVASNVTSIDVRPTINDASATMTVNGAAVTSGNASTISLNVGANTIVIAVTAQDGTTIRIYTLTVTRAAPLPPVANDVSATVAANSSANAITLNISGGTPTWVAVASAAGHGATVLSGMAITYTPNPGYSGSDSFTYTATNGGGTSAPATVTITVSPPPPSITAQPSSSTIAAGGTASFSVTAENATGYQWQVDQGAGFINISDGALYSGATSATLSITGATIELNGYQYRVVVYRVGTGLPTSSAVSDAAALTVNSPPMINAIHPHMGPAAGGTVVTIGGTNFTGATAVQFGSEPASGVIVNSDTSITATTPAGLAGAVGVSVTTSGGTTTVSAGYRYVDGTLSNLTISSGTLSPAFAPGTLAYTTSVANTVAAIVVVPTLSDASATITVNGSATASGVGGSISLAVGANTIWVVVTAQDGSTRTYQLTITRAAPALTLSPVAGALAGGTTGVIYPGVTVSTSGGTAPYSYAVTGTLPAGLSLNTATGAISGTPTTVESASFTITATDANNDTVAAGYTLAVTAGQAVVPDQEIEADGGMTPAPVRLDAGASGGPFDDAELVSVEPVNAGRAEITQGDYAAAGPVAPVGWYLKFTPDPAYFGQVRVRFRLINAAGSSTGAVTYTFGPARVAHDADSLVRGFVQSRQNMIASTIALPSLKERRRMATSAAPASARLTPSADGLTLGYATSLVQMQAARDKSGDASAAASPFNIWVDGAFLAHRRDDSDGKWGSFGMVSVGADYLVSEKALVGLSFHYDRMTDPTDADGELTGNGWLVGPYASFELGRHVFWDTSLLYGGSANDIGTPFWDGSFDTRRLLFDTAITGQWQLDDVTVLTPRLRAVYFAEKVEDYAVENDAGDRIELDGFAQEQLRVSLGAEIARSFTLESGSTLTPKLGATAGFSGLDGAGLFGSVSSGLSLQAVNGWAIDAALLFNLEGEGGKSVGAKLGASQRF